MPTNEKPHSDEELAADMQKLRDWFAPHAEYWDKVDDIEEALGRKDRDDER